MSAFGQRTAYPSLSRKALNSFVGGPDRVGHEPKVNKSSQVAVSLRDLSCGSPKRRVSDGWWLSQLRWFCQLAPLVALPIWL